MIAVSNSIPSQSCFRRIGNCALAAVKKVSNVAKNTFCYLFHNTWVGYAAGVTGFFLQRHIDPPRPDMMSSTERKKACEFFVNRSNENHENQILA